MKINLIINKMRSRTFAQFDIEITVFPAVNVFRAKTLVLNVS